ncbi:MAG: hypothetical protein KDA75_15725 [Planctomycetaceae bacterium]|nr:hypothetical protein [Planctomycetaceae bacterium]
MVRPKLRRHSRRSIVEALERAARKYGADITLEEFVRETGVSCGTVYRYFSGWPELRLEAELPRNVKSKMRYSDNALLEDPHKVAHLAGHVPTLDDYRTYGHAAVSTLQRRFGPEWMFVQGRYERWVEWKRDGRV